MQELGIKHIDPFDWEVLPNYNQLTTEKKTVKGRKAKIVTVSEDQSIAKTAEQQLSGTSKDGKDPTQSEDCEDKPPFATTEFEKNEIGF